ncbi:leucyl/phenylalanyl-tRNA--protein transferase [Pokkaliibacter sp. CJK22405]|uniref:leucyl/phenylalanyl-tRNA--protein transferase n=1 Tax=Pokkaliibacter sp. CJK22405 TaxID=3384615 RepID=UPI0039850998
MLHWLDETNNFPPTSQALRDPDGLLAVGGDLSSTRLLAAYQRGIFPWYSEGSPILWWSPAPRFVIYPDELNINRSLRKAINKTPFDITINQAFEDVISFCADVPRPGQDGTWIQPEMQAAYIAMHQVGWAHSVDVWHDGQLVGGLYGLAVGRVFFGESMFSLMPNASKVAFALWCQKLNELGCDMIDCQMETPHMVSMGGRRVLRNVFERRLKTTQSETNYLRDAIKGISHQPLMRREQTCR